MFPIKKAPMVACLAVSMLAATACTKPSVSDNPQEPTQSTSSKPDATSAPEVEPDFDLPVPADPQDPKPQPAPLEEVMAINLEAALFQALKDPDLMSGAYHLYSREKFMRTLDLIDYYNESMDLLLADGSESTKGDDAYFTRWDNQSYMMVEVQTWFQKLDSYVIDESMRSGPQSVVNTVRHPYTLLHLIKADLNRPSGDRLLDRNEIKKRFSFSDKALLEWQFLRALDQNTYFASERSGNRTLSKSYETQLQISWPWQVRNQELLPVGAAMTTYQYRKLQYLVEVNRLLLDWMSDKAGLTGEATDQRRYVYYQMRSSLLERTKKALALRFPPRPEHTSELPTESVVKPSDRSAGNSIGETLPQRTEGIITIGPGIHRAEQNLTIFAGEIRFHPLAVIHAPGKTVILDARTIVSPWVDVSGDPMPELDGQSAGRIDIQLRGSEGEILGSLLLVGMGAHGRNMSCLSTADRPANGGDGAEVTITGGKSVANFKSILAFPGTAGTLHCKGNMTRGIPGKYKPPIVAEGTENF